MSNSWDNVLLPPGYAYGFSGGPAFDTRITKMDGGGEQRVQVVDEPTWRWSATRKNFEAADVGDANVKGLVDFFLARRGSLYGFLFLAADDFSTADDNVSAPTALDQTIGFGDGVTTRFKLRKQYSDPGGMTARDFPRRVVPLLGTATAAVARVLGVETGASIAPAVAVDSVTVTSGVVWKQQSMEVILPTPPAIGHRVSWGGYHVTPVRFSESTDQGLEATVSGFMADDAPFQVESIQFDDPVPLMPGGSPYGHIDYPNATTDVDLSARGAFYVSVQADTNIYGYIDPLDNYPTGGPHLFIANYGAFTVTLRDSLGATIGTVPTNSQRWLFVKEDASGNRTPALF